MNYKNKIINIIKKFKTIELIHYQENEKQIEIVLYDKYDTGEQFDEHDINNLTTELENNFNFKSIDWSLNNGWKNNDAEYAEFIIIK